ncbi:MAG: cytochrome c [Vicinamibacterales bacterium]
MPASVRILPLTLATCALALASAAGASAQTAPTRTGAELYQAACAGCHAPDGKGQARTVVGFDTPLPDFTDCKFTTPEPDGDWMATIHLGGRARAFSTLMPSFIDALTSDEIARIVRHLRSFCTDNAWPRGDLNLPRPFVTEKAFPENESVWTVNLATSHPRAVESEFIYEHRIGRRSQYEVAVPVAFQQGDAGGWRQGLGDIAVAFKHVVLASLPHGSILSLGGEMLLPTGKESEGLGGGQTIVETFGTFSQILPHDGFLHVHAGIEVPVRGPEANKEAYARLAFGRTFTQNHSWGRAWSPMMELVAAREVGRGEPVLWDVVPQMQVSLSTRQHILLDAGVRVPANERAGRGKTFLFYVIWDWFDGGLLEGW